MKKLGEISVIICCFLFGFCSLLMGLSFEGIIKKADGVALTDTSSYVKVNEIWNGKGFNEGNLNNLMQLITGSGETNVYNMNNLVFADAPTIKAKNYNKAPIHDVVVRVAGLDWQAVCLTQAKNQDWILTLWLSNNFQEAFANRSNTEGYYHGYSSGPKGGILFSSWAAFSNSDPSVNLPSNLYGANYIRSVVLNNGYAFAGSGSQMVPYYPNENSAFAKFTMPSVEGNITDYIVKPVGVIWQEYGQSASAFGLGSYSLSNENWSNRIPDYGNYMGQNYNFNSYPGGTFNYASKSLNDWSQDNLWLPSYTEIKGMWKTSDEQNKSYTGKDEYEPGFVGTIQTPDRDNLYSDTWLRSADPWYANNVYYLDVAGDTFNTMDVWHRRGVRPAFHLNLTTAAASLQKYTVKLLLNGGNINGNTGSHSFQDVAANSVFRPQLKPVKTGYTLTGWRCLEAGYTYGLDSNGYLYVDRFPMLTRPEATFEAQWAVKKIKVTANPNGGSLNFNALNGWTKSGDNAVKDIAFDSSFGALPSLNERTGYDFIGWFDSGGNKFESESVMSVETAFTIFARWEAKTFYIYFDANGGSGNMSAAGVKYNAGNVKLPSNIFVKEGYIFKGWNTQRDGSGTIYYENQFVSNITNDFTLYAQWEETWNLYASLSLAGGGVKDDPYLVSSAEDLAFISKSVANSTSFSAVYFKQTRTIDLARDKEGAEVGFLWQPIGSDSDKSFKGHYDGNGYLIKNLTTSSARERSETGEYIYSNVGLFGCCVGATLKNINIISGNVYGKSSVGSIAGCVEAIYVGEDKTGSIEGCRSGVVVRATNKCGMVGTSYGCDIAYCFNYGDIIATSCAGGILGSNHYNKITISNCVARCNIKGSGSGGIIGQTDVRDTEIKSCVFKGDFVVSSNQGLISGYMLGGKITDCMAIVSSSIEVFCPVSCTVENCIYDNGTKKYVGEDFSNWIVMADEQPLPKGLTWLAEGGETLTEEKLQELGFSK